MCKVAEVTARRRAGLLSRNSAGRALGWGAVVQLLRLTSWNMVMPGTVSGKLN
jgi:hypothetical protein